MMQVSKEKKAVKYTFSRLQSRFGANLKSVSTQILFSKDVNDFVKKMNQANAVTAKSSLIFK